MKRERARLLTAQAQKAERQNLLQLPGRVAPQLEGEPHAMIKTKLTSEVYAALAALAVNVKGATPEPMGGDPAPAPITA